MSHDAVSFYTKRENKPSNDFFTLLIGFVNPVSRSAFFGYQFEKSISVFLQGFLSYAFYGK